jgi:hypothetical protein
LARGFDAVITVFGNISRADKISAWR